MYRYADIRLQTYAEGCWVLVPAELTGVQQWLWTGRKTVVRRPLPLFSNETVADSGKKEEVGNGVEAVIEKNVDFFCFRLAKMKKIFTFVPVNAVFV